MHAMVSLLCFNIGGCLYAELNLAVWLPINPLLLHQIIQLYSSLYTQILCRNGYYINATLCGMYLLHIYLLEFATFEPLLRSVRLIISKLLYQAPLVCKKRQVNTKPSELGMLSIA